MKIFLFLCIVLSFGCQSPFSADVIIDKSIEAHGGMDAWNQLEKIEYTKKFTLYTEDGKEERTGHQHHITHIFPQYKNNIINVGGTALNYDGSEYSKLLGDSIVTVTAGDTGLIYSSFYVIGQPFKLKDPGVELAYQGIDTLLNGKEVHVVQAKYAQADKENHLWWYYFDTKDYRCVGNMVDHNGTYNVIINDSYMEYQGILWNKDRTGYWTDENGDLGFKRSIYGYNFGVLE